MPEILEIGLCGKFFPGSVLHVVISIILVFITGYLLGSLNFGVIISRAVYRDDIRNHGSKNAGAANMLRVYGKLPAAMTFLGDGLKAAAAVFLGAVFLGYDSVFAGTYIGGIASVIGHAFPVYYGFKGGKSIATAFFMGLCTQPLVALICAIFYAVIVAATRFSSLGSIAGAVVYPLVLYMFAGKGPHNIVAIFLTLMLVFLHRDNIRRLISGTENKLY